MLVLSNQFALSYHGVKDKLKIFRVPSKQNFLDDMISIDVRREISDEVLQIFNQKLNMVFTFDDFNDFLNASGAMRICTEANRIQLNRVNYFSELIM